MSDRVQIYSKKWRGKSCQLAELLAPWRAWSGQTIISKKERESNRAKKEVIERKLLRKKGSYWEKVILQKKEKSYWQACPPQTIDHLKKRGKLIGTPGSRDHHGKSYRPREIIRTEKEKQADVTGRLIIDQSTKSCPWSLRPAQRLSISWLRGYQQAPWFVLL